jgi:glycosyltransferase involved in cell wall biosynthesis
MRYSVVIPAYQAAATLATVLAAWRAASPIPESILVVDDGSTDDTAEIAKGNGVKAVKLKSNSGRGAARARGFLETDTPFVLMSDTALVPREDFLANAIPWFSQPKVSAAFAYVTPSKAGNFVDRWKGRHLFKSKPPAMNRRALLATGVCLLRRAAVEQVGGFDVMFRSGEDADLGRRLLAADWEVVADPNLCATSLSRESAHALLARYARWNSPQGIRGGAWWRQLAYAARTMAREDLEAGDPLAALLSLASPFYQLRRR